ncbi:enoyl-CoA hydratase-related protein [Bradyrhizobium diazoefficiens]|uniref:enoyl-CoA hydratase-related protein n=1 Tax=Bradyrhizobium diazoefficiens TaxID=1355477 RepID=UPI001FEFCA50|nr:enoyl-CoA hydratase-related protein [Bradyrhizobium diazoefficiens]
MNVFSETAIVELAAFARWLAQSDVRGVLVRSGKSSAFCAGADLAELGVAYDMIMAKPAHARFNVAYDHFFRLSLAIRALESCGKPVASAITGLALGGGCELALGTHYRVLTNDPRAALGLPESLVGLLPGGGGTQRLPRLIGVERALPVLLEGARLSGTAALEGGLVDALVAAGEEVAAAESWLLSTPTTQQPWDRADWKDPSPLDVSKLLGPVRERVLSETLGHYPAPLAILDCVEFGLPQCFDGAIRSEMAIFSHLIQRAEARNMIQTLFLGRTDHDRMAKSGELPAFIADFVTTTKSALEEAHPSDELLATLGFARPGLPSVPALRRTAGAGYWLDQSDQDSRRHPALALMQRLSQAVLPLTFDLTAEQLRMADYAVVRELGYPAYLGGPGAFGLREASAY